MAGHQLDLYGLFLAAHESRPDEEAIRDRGRSLTYSDLGVRVAQLVEAFGRAGLRREQFVGVYARSGAELVATLLALTKLGAVFVPLDLAYPLERLVFMIEDAKLSHLLLEQRNPELEARVSCPVLPLAELEVEAAPPLSAQVSVPDPRETCYVIYTSGTTGDPKGVLVHCGGAMNSIVETAKVMDIRAEHRLLALCPIGFDVFVLEVGLVLISAATLVFTESEGVAFDDLLRREDIQHILCTPTSVADVDLRGTPLHTVMFGGELLPDDVVAKYLGSFRIVHAYGVTETAICATLNLCDDSYPVAMGTPVPNTTLELLDAKLEPVGEGEAGELVLGGISVSNGYLDRPELTAQRFIADPRRPGHRRFRTGDLAKRDAQGKLYFLGRNDRQIKYREFRLELYEVEALLLRHQSVSQAAALVEGDQLFAYVCSASPLAPSDLAAYLARLMPAQLLPEIRLLEAMPLTTHKKTDYGDLRRRARA